MALWQFRFLDSKRLADALFNYKIIKTCTKGIMDELAEH